jgi:hypothetical protein
MSFDTMESFSEGRDECLALIEEHRRVLHTAALLATPARARQLCEAEKALRLVARRIRRKVLP